ncbi:MAG: PspC domain-containing protein [Eubacteriaceae bacterium]
MKKRLYKDKSTGILAGVCSGIAQYFDTDASIVRILYVVLSVISAAFPLIIVYILLIIIMPEKSSLGFTDYKINDDK